MRYLGNKRPKLTILSRYANHYFQRVLFSLLMEKRGERERERESKKSGGCKVGIRRGEGEIIEKRISNAEVID